MSQRCFKCTGLCYVAVFGKDSNAILSPRSRVHIEKLIVTHRLSVSQGISHILCNTRIYCCVHKGAPLACVLSQIDPVHIFHPICLRSILSAFADLSIMLFAKRIATVSLVILVRPSVHMKKCGSPRNNFHLAFLLKFLTHSS